MHLLTMLGKARQPSRESYCVKYRNEIESSNIFTNLKNYNYVRISFKNLPM